MKKLFSILIIVLLVFTSVPTFAFSDVNSSDWYEPYVQKATENKLVKGYADGSFKPKNNITVAEFIGMTLNALESKGSTFAINYSGSHPGSNGRVPSENNQYTVYLSYDLPLVPPRIIQFEAYTNEAASNDLSSSGNVSISNVKAFEGKWYYKQYLMAIGSGLITNSDFTLLDLERKITRAEIALITNNALGLLNEKQKATANKVFSDSIDEKFMSSIQNLNQEKIMSGFKDYSFKPSNAATRAEAAVVILKMVDPSYRK